MVPPAWRTRYWTWVLPLAVVLVNAAILVAHPGRTGSGFADMKNALESETRVLQALRDKQSAIERVLADARASSAALEELYGDRFATEEERLTRLITEVKRLAQRAGLEPEAISYPEETIEEYGLVRMSLVFGVEGTYAQLRTLINLLEVSELFLVLDRVGLRNSAASVLGISLQISTYFVRDPDEASPDARRRTGAAGEGSRGSGARARNVAAGEDAAAPPAARSPSRERSRAPGDAASEESENLDPVERALSEARGTGTVGAAPPPSSRAPRRLVS